MNEKNELKKCMKKMNETNELKKCMKEINKFLGK